MRARLGPSARSQFVTRHSLSRTPALSASKALSVSDPARRAHRGPGPLSGTGSLRRAPVPGLLSVKMSAVGVSGHGVLHGLGARVPALYISGPDPVSELILYWAPALSVSNPGALPPIQPAGPHSEPHGAHPACKPPAPRRVPPVRALQTEYPHSIERILFFPSRREPQILLYLGKKTSIWPWPKKPAS